MFRLTRSIAGRYGIMVLAGLLTVMATGVASAAPPKEPARHSPRIHDHDTSRPAVGLHKHGVLAPGLHARSHDAKRLYRLGYSAGKQTGWRAGYAAGRNGRPSIGLVCQPLNGRNAQYRLGFRAGYGDAYAQGYRQGRADRRPVLRFSFRW